jgi:hypothetical protein
LPYRESPRVAPAAIASTDKLIELLENAPGPPEANP